MATPTEQPTEEGIEATPRACVAQSLLFQDSSEDMTYGRRVALWLNERFPGFYGPESGPNAPSLAKAWAFFEHVTLERYIVQDDNDDNDNDITDEAARSSGKRQSTDRKMSIAEPGEHHYRTKLYPLLTTPLSQLGDFGLGFGLYFSTLRDFAILALLGGLLSLPNLLYFASTDYDSTTNENLGSGLLRGSAICLDRKWVPCPTCQKDEFEKQNKGAYPIKRFSLAWVTVPSDAGYYLNVTDYLDWKLLDTNHSIEDINSESEWLTWDLVFNRTEEQNVVRLDNLRNATIPTTDAYGSIVLNEQDGFILNGTNVTEQLGYTPLWCGYSTPSDCYLDLYPSITEKHEDGFVDDPSQTRVGDSDFVEVGFALKNLCDGATAQQGWINWGTLLIMILGTTHIYFRTERMEVRFDEDEQTAQDYSIIVKNPPPDAWYPEEWKAFFEQALDNDPDHPNNSGSPRNKVTVCTVDVDNEAIIGYLVRRRDLRRQIEMALPPDTPLDIETLKKEVERIQEEKTGMCSSKSPVPLMVKKLEELETEIRTFFKTVQEPDTTQVYLTFETESAQRRVLKQMSIGTLDARRNKTEGIDPLYLFRGKHALEVREPDEPSTIRWQELNATESTVLIRKIATSLATVGFVLAAYYIIRRLYLKNQPWWAGIVTTLFTILFPIVANILMGFEKHHNDTERQKWLFVKIASFNILVSTVLLALVTPFQATLDQRENSLPGLIPAVHSLFFSQITLSPILQLLDIGGNISRFVLAPRAKTQAEMNMLMKGTPVQLAERYANMMKFLFMTLWYCSIYPASFFMGSVALTITFFVDRFSMMRSWARSSQVGSEVADFIRYYYSPLAICLMSVVSAYYWSGFPYDNLCLDENATLPDYFLGTWEVAPTIESFNLFGGAGETLGLDVNLEFNVEYVGEEFDDPITIAPGDDVYKYCNQDLRFSPGQWTFPALPQFQPAGLEWMTSEQEEIVSVHGWSSLVVTLLMVLVILSALAYRAHRYLVGKHVNRGQDQNIAYSDVQVIDSYIPQVASPFSPYPYVLCNIVNIDTDLFNWQDEAHPHVEYDVTRDIATILGTEDHPKLFAQVKHWPGPREEVVEAPVYIKREVQTKDGVVNVYDEGELLLSFQHMVISDEVWV